MPFPCLFLATPKEMIEVKTLIDRCQGAQELLQAPLSNQPRTSRHHPLDPRQRPLPQVLLSVSPWWVLLVLRLLVKRISEICER